MSSYRDHLSEKTRARREAIETHIKSVASHAIMPISSSQVASHLSKGGNTFDNEKENTCDSDIHLRTITKSRLRRLGVHYSDDGTISSPINRTEEEFCVEEEGYEGRPSAKSEARSARLARLASTINQWEDDLSHPTVVVKSQATQRDVQSAKHDFVSKKSKENSHSNRILGEKTITPVNNLVKPKSPLKPCNYQQINETNSIKKCDSQPNEQIMRKPPTIVKYSTKESAKRDAPVDSQTPLSALDHPARPKRIMWDSTIIASLEDQGFERCESREHLVYDYIERRSPAKCLSPSRTPKNDFKQPTPPTTVSSNKVVPATQASVKNVVSSVKSNQKIVDSDLYDKKKVLRELSQVKVTPKSPIKIPVGVDEGNESPSFRKQAILTKSITSELTPVLIDKSTARKLEQSKNSPIPRHDSPSKSPSPRKNTQVLEMAAQFEEGSPTKKMKETDPSELPLSQRKALFEKNRGNAPLLPKAPLTMAIPPKALTAPSPKALTAPSPKGIILTKSHGGSPVRPVDPSEDRLREIREEREKEMELLRNRWEANKKRNDNTANSSPTHHIQIPEPSVVEEEEEVVDEEMSEDDDELCSPRSAASSNSRKCPHTGYPMLGDIRRIRVSPPKPGHLYPSISDIETETETESEVPENNNRSSDHPGDDESMEESDTSSGSLGQTIVKIANMSSANLKRHNDSSFNHLRSEEARVLNEIDDFLDEALGEPSPPKRSRDSSFDNSLTSSNLECSSVRSDSFEFSRTLTDKSLDICRTSTSQDIAESKPSTQLVHTISLYRKQKEMTIKATTTIRRPPQSYGSISEDTERDSSIELEEKHLPSEDELVSNRIHELLLEISKQQTVISQATQALNLCSSTIEFSGSAEQTEAERLLLIASQKRVALSQEVDRIRVERRVHPSTARSKEKGDLTIHSITLPLKMDVIRLAAREERCYYVLVLVRSGAALLATEMLPALPKNLKQSEPFLLTFKTPLTLSKLYSDFTVNVEVYTLETRSKELLPHDIKYHITPSAKKEKMRMTPKKGGKGDSSRLVMGPLESPGGPLAVRSSSFKLSGFSVFSLREIKKTNFTLSKVPYGSVVEGSIQVRMSCEMTLEGMEYRGFLTMFQDVSGFGAWHRRWCYLKDNTISYWLYPEHEHTKIPLDTIDLGECCSEGEIGLVPRDVCARPNTFLLETMRSRLPSDSDSLVMKTNKDTTLIRHLLSADTKEDRMEWCSRINQCLSLLKAWGKRPNTGIKHTQL